MSYFYWFKLKASEQDTSSKPSLDAFNPIQTQYDFNPRTDSWSVQIETDIEPRQAIALYQSLTVHARSWINEARMISSQAVGGPYADSYQAFVSAYCLTYANQTITPLK